MGEEAQRIEPMVDGDDDNAARGKTRAVVARFGAGADDKAAAVNPDHHRQARFCPRSGRRPDVEMEAILGGCSSAEVDVVPHDALHRMRAELMCRPHACPRRNRLRRAPAQWPDRRRGIGDAFVNADAACIRLGDRERAALDRQTVRHQTRHPALVSTGSAAWRRIGISSRPAKRAFEPSASSMRRASFHFAIRSERANEPTLSCPALQPIAR